MLGVTKSCRKVPQTKKAKATRGDFELDCIVFELDSRRLDKNCYAVASERKLQLDWRCSCIDVVSELALQVGLYGQSSGDYYQR